MAVLVPMPRPTPIYVIGDSHVFALSDRLFRTTWGELVEFRALYCRNLRAQELVGPSGALDERIQEALRVARIGPRRWVLTENPKGHRSSIGTGDWPGIRALEDRNADPALVIAMGGRDYGTIGFTITETDIELPAEILDDSATPEMCRTAAPGALPAEEAERRFTEPLQPLRLMLRMFRASGVTRVAVLGHPPMSLDEEDCDRNYRSAGFPQAPRASKVAWRYKTLLLVNAGLRRICNEEGFPYIDRWAAYSENGLVRDGLLRDFVHVGDEGATMTAASLVDALLNEPVTAASSNGATSAAHREQYTTAYYQNDCGGFEQFAIFGGRKLEEPRLAAVHALAAAKPGNRVLDIGCGRGELSYAFAMNGAHVTALDYSADAIAMTRATLGDLPARYVCADASSFVDQPGYDVAVAAMAVEHFSHAEMKRLYRNVAAMLLPRGSLILHTTSDARPAAAQDRLLRETFEHVVVWAAASDDPRGSLARPFTAEELQDGREVFAVASHAPIDTDELLRRITMEPLAPAEASVALSASSAPQQVRVGESFIAEVTLHNYGAASLRSFPPNPVRFVYVWSPPDAIEDSEEAFYGAPTRSRIEPGAEPGSSRRYAFEVLAPQDRGPHVLRVSLLQELIRWFDAEVQFAIDVQ